MKQTAVEWLEENMDNLLMDGYAFNSKEANQLYEQAKELENEQQGYSEEEIMNALHSVELKYNRNFTKIYEGVLEYLKELKNK